MERRRRAILLIAAALLVAGIGERRPLISIHPPSSDSVIHAEPMAQASVDIGLFGLSLLVRLDTAR